MLLNFVACLTLFFVYFIMYVSYMFCCCILLTSTASTCFVGVRLARRGPRGPLWTVCGKGKSVMKCCWILLHVLHYFLYILLCILCVLVVFCCMYFVCSSKRSYFVCIVSCVFSCVVILMTIYMWNYFLYWCYIMFTIQITFI